MIRDMGIVKPGTTLVIPFHAFDSNDPSASVTISGLATTDIEVYKGTSMTQRGSDNGYALLDTDGIDLDGTTGIHGISIDLADNSTAGFYAAGEQYTVVIASVTIDAATINFIPVTFRIGQPAATLNTTIATLASQTSFTLTNGPAEDDALNGDTILFHDVASAVQTAKGLVIDYAGSTKTVTLAVAPTFTIAATDNVSVFTGPANLPPALPGAAGGGTICGSNAATTFAGLTTGALSCTTITASGAVALQSTLTVTGNTTFTGTTAYTGNVSYADGLTIAAPSTANRSGLSITGNGSGHGMLLTSGALGAGLRVTGATGANIDGTGGVGVTIAGQGANAGLRVTGGATGVGVSIIGGGTSGDGLSITTTSGHGINVAPVGTSKHAVLLTGGNGGTSDGLKLAAGTGGVGFRIDTLTASGAVTLSSTLDVTGAFTASNASNNIVGIDVASAATISTQVAADLLAAHGSGSWQTATGFAVAGDAMTLTAAYDAAKTAATQASVDAVPTVAEIWETALTEAYRATGATGTGAQLMYELLGNLINFANAGTRRTVTKLDKATTAKEYDYDDGSNPTACEEFS